MTKLSDFLGEIIKSLATARTYADYSAVATSEIYNSDPFLKELPIPHYLIEEAEIDVPVMVMDVFSQSENQKENKEKIKEVLNNSLKKILLESYKWNLINKRKRDFDENSKNQTSSDEKHEFVYYSIAKTTIEKYNQSIDKVCEVVINRFNSNLDLYNYDVVKLLEIVETLKKELKIALTREKQKMPEELNPFTSDDSVDNLVNYVSNIMFYNFIKILKSDSAIQVDVNTSRMEEYVQENSLMHIKIKVKEQDFKLVVEEKNSKSKEPKRYLSLT